MLFHRDIEPITINRESSLSRYFFGHFKRKPIRIVEKEGHRAVEGFALSCLIEVTGEDGRSSSQRLAELSFLAFNDHPDSLMGVSQRWVVGRHDLNDRIDQRWGDKILNPQKVGKTNRSTHDSSEDKTSVFV